MLKAKLSKGPIRIAGTMSGTSMDGVDVAVLETDGERILGFGETAYRAFSDAERRVIATAMGQWTGPDVDRAVVTVQAAHTQVLRGFDDVDLIGFHGQTLSHDPRGGRTLQVGDGDQLAQDIGTPVVWDFRNADVRMGGEGAPLAPFFHFACAKWIKADAPLAFLNLGGVGNLTWVDPRKTRPEDEGALLAFDTGPANAPIDDLMKERLGKPYDQDGALARRGEVETGALELFLAESYFTRMPPKSLDRNDFAEMIKLVKELSDVDAAATLTGMAAAGVAQGIEHCPTQPEVLLVTGGGRKNPVMMEMLRVSLDCVVKPVEEVGLDGDMLEAQAFAYLAARVARGLPTSGPSTTGVKALVGGGVLSCPT
ncbi:anhydro-N-acetylmuramic acid kinase [Cognatishimia maritima]|uniref:Anhydro-N-acetylmuramic acid kinase n=1 Tax=Cognatishimia maritima TaxID=870908 RepID=A0A1M5IVG6_9RHOB|nr:anhydro-N-acetylmuramic acid kinase [Cognatishimia maritima]SHG32294.1 anhydro-N-acetylmuramic acid kinase [Cognatishimia maritima]